jgi:hypothetical protein
VRQLYRKAPTKAAPEHYEMYVQVDSAHALWLRYPDQRLQGDDKRAAESRSRLAQGDRGYVVGGFIWE